jgi:hypothetical protein
MQATSAYFDQLTPGQRLLFFCGAAKFVVEDLRHVALDEERSDAASRSASIPRAGLAHRLLALEKFSDPEECAALVNNLVEEADRGGIRGVIEGAFDFAVRTVANNDVDGV